MRNNRLVFTLVLVAFVLMIGFALFGGATAAPGDVTDVYVDGLESGWSNGSWGGTTTDYANSSPVNGGTTSVAITYTQGYGVFAIQNSSAIAITDTDSLTFSIHGGSSGGQTINVALLDDSFTTSGEYTLSALSTGWQTITLTMSTFTGVSDLRYILWKSTSASAQDVFYVDDVYITEGGTPTPTNTPTTGPTATPTTAATNTPTPTPSSSTQI
ncbi:MAG: hypothetical protein AAF633_03020 [Chloroflexota bacterium]